MKKFSLPYGNSHIEFVIPETSHQIDLILPKEQSLSTIETDTLATAIRNPMGFPYQRERWAVNRKIAITINDKTRPVPNNKIFPPLLKVLEEAGAKNKDITIIIATGTHTPMPENENELLLKNENTKDIKMVSHNCDEEENLLFRGTTSFGTPVHVNALFDQADIKIVVGNIEPHHFAGFSGGAKSAAIGVCGRKTINHNHALLKDPHSSVGRYEDNPLRQDIEEIGRLIGIDLAFNVILNEKKEILHAFWGDPEAVMKKGVELIRENDLINIQEPYDLVIAAAGGHPKDINLYQSQKALTHASLFCRKGGQVILAAACSEGVGSQSYLEFMKNVNSHEEAKNKLEKLGFTVGPHKSYQFAQIAEKVDYKIKCEIESKILESLLIKPVLDIQTSIENALASMQERSKIAVIPYATATIPIIQRG